MAVQYTIACGIAWHASDATPIEVSEVVRVERHRKGESSVSVAIVTSDGEIVAEVGRFFHGCALPYDYEDVSTFIEECENKARAVTASEFGRFLCYPERFTTDIDGTLALLARFTR